MKRRFHRGGRTEAGATLVEFAILLPILVLFIFGIIDFGKAFNDSQSIRQGAREGARDAVVADYGSTTGCGLNGPASGVGGAAGSNAQKTLCTVKDRTGLGNTVRVKLAYTADPTGFDSERVKVCTTRPVETLTGLFDNYLGGINQRTEIEMRAEKDLDLVTTQETDPSGSNWSWC